MAGDDAVGHHDAGDRREPVAVFQVLGVAQGLVERSGRFEHGPPDGALGEEGGLDDADPAPAPPVGVQRLVPLDRAVVHERFGRRQAVHAAAFRIVVQDRHGPGQRVRRQRLVGVEEEQDVTGGHGRAGVAGHRDAAVDGVLDEPAGIAAGDLR
jgi:hypothetical protein